MSNPRPRPFLVSAPAVLPSPAYQCKMCGAEADYAPVCPHCKAVNTLRLPPAVGLNGALGRAESSPPSRGPKPMRVQTAPIPRLVTGLGPFDKALGGGFVPGSAVLLSGERGAGKSTLSLRLVAAMSDALYIASEETQLQVEYRMTRTAIEAAGVPILETYDVEEILEWASDYRLLLVDSVHRLRNSTEASEALIRYVKEEGKSLVCVAHLTKDGTVRGPSTFGYLYDVEIEVRRVNETARELVTLKNRWGPEGHWPLYLTEKGWEEVPPEPPQES
jgi:DNA repair protein RadA/Sms